METIAQLYRIFQDNGAICTDSRKVAENAIFFALKGDNFNGNKYAVQALAKGAAVAVIDEVEYQIDARCILVDNVLECLQQLARHHRRQFAIPVLAITGSNGKTTTKELVSSVLTTQYRTHFTKGNFNNHIGVPLTLLDMPLDTEIAVIEMGANHLLEIDLLCQIVEPTHGLITNIGKAHLEGFGSLEGVKKAKSELYRFLENNKGIAFVNQDEAYLPGLAEGILRVINYVESAQPSKEIVPYEISFLGANPYVKVAFLSPLGELYSADSQLVGVYNFNNIKTSIAVGKYFKVPAEKIKTAIEQYVPSNNRSQIVTYGTNQIILDAYNANPSSMRSALDNFSELEGEHKIAIMGDMLELGAYSATEHRAILEYANTLNITTIITVGAEFGAVKIDNQLHFDNVISLQKWWSEQTLDTTKILLKGSRGIGLEEVLRASI